MVYFKDVLHVPEYVHVFFHIFPQQPQDILADFTDAAEPEPEQQEPIVNGFTDEIPVCT